MAPINILSAQSKPSNIAFGPTLGGLIGGFTLIAICVISYCVCSKKRKSRMRKERRREYLTGVKGTYVSENPVGVNGPVDAVGNREDAASKAGEVENGNVVPIVLDTQESVEV
ncbi:hypothetical protein TWF718_005995 [Orbilia javanica]|uniref:Uncharacterized protein n=1 Tax=Orbilia javanica TaxID=47235 RepID=A0AAN8MVQ7_9PEZI